MLQDVKSPNERWEARISAARAPLTPSVFPGDAVAVIHKPERSLEWVERTLGPEAIRSRTQERNDSPAIPYPAPKDVLRDSALSVAEKRDVLRRWALDAYLIESAQSHGDAAPHPSRLDEAIDALIDLDEPELRGIAARAPKSTDRGKPVAA